jgi:hypothetical protein
MDTNLKKIISNLIEGTKLRSLRWEPSERDNEFRLTLEHGIIQLDVWDGGDPWSGDPPEEMADIVFFNSEGIKVDRYFFSKKKDLDSYSELVALHDAARRSYLRVEETLSGLFAEIEKKAAGD